jgi:hypothetical protein
MRCRYLNNPKVLGWTDRLNECGIGETIIHFDEGDATSEFISELEILLVKPLPSSTYRPNTWVPLSSAFKTRDVVTDNYDRTFREAISDGEKAQGWYPADDTNDAIRAMRTAAHESQ